MGIRISAGNRMPTGIQILVGILISPGILVTMDVKVVMERMAGVGMEVMRVLAGVSNWYEPSQPCRREGG